MAANAEHPADALCRILLELLKIPSVTGNEAQIADSFERWALSRVPRLELQRFGNNLVLGDLTDARPCVALVGHLDTVPPHPSDPAPHREGDRVLGRGATDMKSGISVARLLFESLPLDRLPYALLFVLYDREEGPFAESGLKILLEEVKALSAIDLAVILEPTDNVIEVGCLGSLHAKVVVRGKAAHSARPWQGASAIDKALPLLTRVAARAPVPVNVGGLTFKESMCFTLASAGQARNVVPDRFELNLNYRFAPADDPEVACKNAVATVRDVVGDAEIEVVDLAPPGSVPKDNPILTALALQVGGLRRPKEAWTDVARFGLWGIDAVNFGPGTPAQAHQAAEWVSVSQMVACYETLQRFLGTPPPEL
ncbi:MAG: succinyl-diaminopimelate desuccinylase [Deltaproteobacteria bacterium]|nr:succinyl-diaminopimelate desuccinylase [Deltaproteobacteria bacterium]